MRVKTKKRKWFTPFKFLFNSFFAILNFILVSLLIASAFSDFISPEKQILFAYLGLAFPVLLLLNFCFLIYWLLTKRFLPAIVLVIVFIICWKPITVYFPVHSKTEINPSEDIIKVLSYNVMSFAYKDNTKESPNKIIRYIAESDADIVCLQEYFVSSRNNLMSSREVAANLPMYPYITEIFFSSQKNTHDKYGLAVLSKFPIKSSRRIPFPSAYNGSAIHEINVNGKNVYVINNHLESFKLTAEDRSKYSDIITHANLESLDDLRGSIQQKLKQAFLIRAKQANIIAGEINKTNGYYTIVCGDFNDTPISYARRTIKGSLNDAFVESGFGMGISYNQNFFLFRIDHILHSSSMEAYNCRIDTKVKLSDHYPIFCYLKLSD
jgi:Metal-dependent hydrolase